MDLFPYILVRKAGISQKLLAAPTIDSSFLKSIDQSEKKYHSFKENFIQYIDEIIQINESPCIRVHLINIRRAISNNKKVNQKDLIRITTHSFKVELLNKIASFKQLHLNKQESISVYNNAFSDAQVAEVSHLFKCKENPNLLNALLFSSPQFFERLNRIKFDVRIFNKKTMSVLSNSFCV